MVSCLRCDKRAQASLAYEERPLCREHFNRLFQDRVKRALREAGFPKRGDCAAVALSGGKDSAALLHVLHSLAERQGFELKPILVDEGIAGYRPACTKKARELCGQLGYELYETSYKELFGTTMDLAVRSAKRKQEGVFTPCSFCGVWRRKALEQTARAVGADCVVTGHNLDDLAQTFLMNLLRGEPLRRVSLLGECTSSGSLPLLKPLLYCPERECGLYSKLNKLPFHAGQCPYVVRGLRHRVRAFLRELESDFPGRNFALLGSLRELQEKKDLRKVSARLKECSVCGGPTPTGLCRPCEYQRALAP